jgi:hypothetical protein
LLTLETGSRVARHMWFDAKAGDNLSNSRPNATMAPTVYAHISLLQPHAQTINDLPIRMYGVMPVNVEDPTTRLQAQIDMPDVIKPGEFFNVSLRELGGKACTYTIDIVDEGFARPHPFQNAESLGGLFCPRSAWGKNLGYLRLCTWRLCRELERILAIGGDGINKKPNQHRSTVSNLP